MKTIDYYLNQPWTVERHEHNDDGFYLSLTIAELPGFIVAGSERDLDQEFWEALRSHLLSFLEEGKEPPTVQIDRNYGFPRVTKFRVAGEGDRTISPSAPEDPYSSEPPLPMTKSNNLQLA